MVKNQPANAGDAGDAGSLGPSLEGGNCNPVFLPGKFLGQRAWWSTVHGGHKESDTTEHTCARTKNVSSKILEWETGIDTFTLVILCMK